MFELITISSIGIGVGLGCIATKLKQKFDEKQSLINVSRKNLADAEKELFDLRKEILELKNLRKNAESNNKKMFNLLNEVADRAVQCPLGSEKIVLQKIIDLTRTYQTPIR